MGPNMTFKTKVIRKIGQFRGDVGIHQIVARGALHDQVDLFAQFLRHSTNYGERCSKLTIVPVLTGAMPFAVDLIRALGDDSQAELFSVSSSSYGRGRKKLPKDKRNVALAGDPDVLKGRKYLVVDDVVESGGTLIEVTKKIRETIATIDPSAEPDIRTAVVCQKIERESEFTPDFVLFSVPDVWLAGYGLDGSTGRFRGLNWIGKVPKDDQEEAGGLGGA